MSNQVYFAPDRKFLDYAGTNVYQPTINQPIATTVTAPILFAATIEDPVPATKFVKSGSQIDIVADSGMYSFSAILGMQSSTPATVDIDVDIYLAVNGDVVSQQIIRIPAKGVSTGADQRVLTLSWVGFLAKDDVVVVYAKNEEGTDLTILAADSFLYITKLV